MKTLGRILIILIVTAVVTAALYLIFNSGAAGTTSGLGPHGEGWRQGESGPGLGGGEHGLGGRHLGRGEDREGGSSLADWARNVGVIALIVALIAVPTSLTRRKRISAAKPGPGDTASM